MPGLPREIIFQHMEKPPNGKVTIEFLQKQVWWWRLPQYELQLWIQEELDHWPNCKWLRTILEKFRPGHEFQKGEAEAFLTEPNPELSQLFETQGVREIIAAYWAGQVDAAMEYEWQARELGSYPNGKPYCCLSPKEQRRWTNKYSKLNLHHEPVLWKGGDRPAILGGKFMKDKWTQPYRFNLLHPDGYIWREFQQELHRERQRLGQPNPGPRDQNRNRRTNPRSWSHIENVDIKCHSNEVTPSRTRQAEWRKHHSG